MIIFIAVDAVFQRNMNIGNVAFSMETIKLKFLKCYSEIHCKLLFQVDNIPCWYVNFIGLVFFGID